MAEDTKRARIRGREREIMPATERNETSVGMPPFPSRATANCCGRGSSASTARSGWTR